MEGSNRKNKADYSVCSKESISKDRAFLEIFSKRNPAELSELREFRVELSSTFFKKLTVESLVRYI